MPFELSIFNDGSTDSSSNIISEWTNKLKSRNISGKLNQRALTYDFGASCAIKQCILPSQTYKGVEI